VIIDLATATSPFLLPFFFITDEIIVAFWSNRDGLKQCYHYSLTFLKIASHASSSFSLTFKMIHLRRQEGFSILIR